MKIFKWFIYTVITLPLIVIAILIGLLFLVDPSEYRQEIEQIAKNNAGVKVSLNGDIGWTFYPNLGIAMEDVSLYENVKSNKVLLSAGEVILSLQLLPLITGSVHIDGLVLSRFQANLSTDKKGVGNWQKLFQLTEKQTISEDRKLTNQKKQSLDAQNSSSQTLQDASIRHITIIDSTIDYRDGQSDQQWTLHVESFLINDFVANHPFPLNTQIDVHSVNPAVQANILLESQITVDEKLTELNIDNSEIELAVTTDYLPGGIQNATLTFSAQVDLEKKTFFVPIGLSANLLVEQFGTEARQELAIQTQISGNFSTMDFRADDTDIVAELVYPQLLTQSQTLRIQTQKINASINRQLVKISGGTVTHPELHATIEGELNGFDSPTAKAVFVIDKLNPRKILDLIQIDGQSGAQLIPSMSSEQALSLFSLQTDIEFVDNILKLQNLLIIVDDSNIVADTSYSINTNQIDAIISIDDINIDNYLPAKSSVKSQAQASAPVKPITPTALYSKDPIIPRQLLNAIYTDIAIDIAKLQVKGKNITNAKAKLKNSPNRIQISAKANGLKGKLDAKASLIKDETFAITLSTQLNNIDIAQANAMILEDDLISGNANLSANLTMDGNSLYHWVHSLNGRTSLSLEKGRIVVVNLSKQVCAAINTVSGSSKKHDWVEYTSIEQLVFFAQIKNGKAKLNNTKIVLPDIRALAKGEVKLPLLDFSIPLGFSITGTDINENCKAPEDLAKIEWPVICRGNLLTTKAIDYCRPDFAKISELIKSATQEKIDNEKQKLEQKAQEKIDEQKKRAKQIIEDKKIEAQKQLEKQLKDKLKDLF